MGNGGLPWGNRLPYAQGIRMQEREMDRESFTGNTVCLSCGFLEIRVNLQHLGKYQHRTLLFFI